MSNSPPQNNMTQTNQDILNSPPHIGTRGQTLGVKQPDSAPGGLLIKRLLKNRYLKQICEIYQLPNLDLGTMQG